MLGRVMVHLAVFGLLGLLHCSKNEGGPDTGLDTGVDAFVDSVDAVLDGDDADVHVDAPTIPDLQPDNSGQTPPGTWVDIPAGTFTMGSPTSERCRHTNEDQHQVTLTRGFEIQNTEVTQAEFEALMGYNPSNFGPNGSEADCGTNCPVEMVNWHEAAAYCNAFSKSKSLPECYDCSGNGSSVTCQEAPGYNGNNIYECSGYRLPTEAEWEYSYRAGTQTAFYSGSISVCRYPGDSNGHKIGWAFPDAAYTTNPVAKKQPNMWGLYDMAGNVWEWTNDWEGSNFDRGLGYEPVTDPWGASSGTSRMLRGGSWDALPDNIRAARRFGDEPVDRRDNVGFRCVRTRAIP